MGVGRWLRNKGFAYTSDQKFARWEDIGGPGPFERWSLQGPWQFMTSRLLNSLAGVVGVLAVGRLLQRDFALIRGVALGMLLGVLIGVAVAGRRMWRRDRDLYDAWLAKQRRREAAAQSHP